MAEDSRVVIVDGARVPTGTFGGFYADVPNSEMGAAAAREALRRAGVSATDVDEFVVGCVGQTGPDAYISRAIALGAGAPVTTTAQTVNRVCGSGLQAIWTAAAEIRLGQADVVVAGGSENMTRQPYMDFGGATARSLADRRLVNGTQALISDPFSGQAMGVTAERVAEKYGISRAAQDEFACQSQTRTQAALAAGAFDKERVPFTKETRHGTETLRTEEQPRAGVTVEKLAKLRPVFQENGTVTAGNSSGINDGAAMLVLMRASEARARGLHPLGELVAFSAVGNSPELMGYAPRYAIEKVLRRAGLTLAEIGWIELNEAFAAQAVAVIRDAGLDPELTNPLGGAISLGHPVGASGAIISLRALKNQQERGIEHSLVTLCIGGGQAVAAIFRAL
ncbi:acetyl-CoA C-acetyltransferase [Actinobaculum suis]|uniref:Probable acetyl-CoA acetyltransferase n=1 Tax=Actinobaculum suis TaxID=1657 RepID=A0A1G6ZQ84_9ACTO|nr:thiolase family protein [Actinobaculum suis]MDY5153951.1 thiolase family protein [Actinobaculum suis]SDE04699.1 acetyl-CoA C-acetyltransferase [Actinobaculum suis]